MAKNKLDKFNKRLAKAGELSDFVAEKLKDEEFLGAKLELTKSGRLSTANYKDLSDSQTSALMEKLDLLIPKTNKEFIAKYHDSMFEELLEDYYEYNPDDGFIYKTNGDRMISSNITKLEDKEQNKWEKDMRSLGKTIRQSRNVEAIKALRNKMDALKKANK